ncbi:MAG: AMP-binding protein [Ornithinimicrobium sp.]
MTIEAHRAQPSPTEQSNRDTTVRVLERLAQSEAPALLTPGLPGPGHHLNGRGFVQRVHDIAGVLAGHGVGRGQVVALLSGPNHPDVVLGRYAVRMVGATVVHLRSMNPRTDEDELPLAAQLDILDRTNADVLVADAESSARAAELADQRPALVVISTTQVAGPAPTPTPNFSDDCAVIDLTSGTTGTPRLVRQSQAGRIELVERLAGDLGSSPIRLLSVTPVTHTTSPMIDAVLLGGGSVVLHRGFEVDAVLDAIEAGVTDIYLATAHLGVLLDHPRTANTDFSGLRRIVYSGTPAARHRVAAARAMFGDAIIQVYGATETGGISALSPQDHDEPILQGTVGQPFPWVEISVRDPDSGESLEPGEAGAIFVRSSTMADGYWAEPEGSNRDPDGWVSTGDLGALEQHGRLRLVGRLDRVIKHGGLKIYPATIESVLLEHPDVSEAVVHGIRDAERREFVHGVVSPRAGAELDESALIAYVADRLSAEHAPTRLLIWHGLPLTHSGKADRQLVRDLLGQ